MVDFEAEIFDDQVPDEFMSMNSDALRSRIRLLANEIRVLKVRTHGTMLEVSLSAAAYRARLLAHDCQAELSVKTWRNPVTRMGVPPR